MHRYSKRLINIFLAVRLLLPLEIVFANESSTQLPNVLNIVEVNSGTSKQQSHVRQDHVVNELNVTFTNEGFILSGIYIPKRKLKLMMNDKEYTITETNDNGNFEFLIEELFFENNRVSIENIQNEEVFMSSINKDELTDQIYSMDKVNEDQSEQLLSEEFKKEPKPTEEPTEGPTEKPTEEPTEEPTEGPTEKPTEEPTEEPTEGPTEEPTEGPTEEPIEESTEGPTENPTEEPTEGPAEESTGNSKESAIKNEAAGKSLSQKRVVSLSELHKNKSDKKNTSFERSTEIEELLHGSSTSSDSEISTFSAVMSINLVQPSRQDFINQIAPRAIAVAHQKGKQGLWPSLMIAQAVHESNFGRSSLGMPPYNNLFGIKGRYEGQSVKMWTWEEVNGKNIRVQADFRSYPSYTESLNDYANLMRNGLSWDKNYYSGTWKSNTKSVWEVLDNAGLRGYATDSNYYPKIRNIINEYNLTKYDTGNYYVRTGTFLGEAFTRQQMSKLAKKPGSYKYRMEIANDIEPYSYRRIKSTTEFIGKASAQKIVNKLQNEKGWSSTIELTGNSTFRYKVQSGFFNTLSEAEKALNTYIKSSGYSARIIKGDDNKYRILTGYFNGETSANDGLKALNNLGWSGRLVKTNEEVPHYIVRTGTFVTPNDVKEAENYFISNKWGSLQQLDTKRNYYYRIVIDGFTHYAEAFSFVEDLDQKYNWSSVSLRVPD